MSRGPGRVERAILEVVQMPEFAAAPPAERWDADGRFIVHCGYAMGLTLKALAVYAESAQRGGRLQRLLEAEYSEPSRSVMSSTSRAVLRLRKLGLVETRFGNPRRVVRAPTDEERAARDARMGSFRAELKAAFGR